MGTQWQVDCGTRTTARGDGSAEKETAPKQAQRQHAAALLPMAYRARGAWIHRHSCSATDAQGGRALLARLFRCTKTSSRPTRTGWRLPTTKPETSDNLAFASRNSRGRNLGLH